MNPSSFEIDFSTVQSQKEMYKLFDSILTKDEGSPSTIENIISARQLVTGSSNDYYIIIYQCVK